MENHRPRRRKGCSKECRYRCCKERCKHRARIFVENQFSTAPAATAPCASGAAGQLEAVPGRGSCAAVSGAHRRVGQHRQSRAQSTPHGEAAPGGRQIPLGRRGVVLGPGLGPFSAGELDGGVVLLLQGLEQLRRGGDRRPFLPACQQASRRATGGRALLRAGPPGRPAGLAAQRARGTVYAETHRRSGERGSGWTWKGARRFADLGLRWGGRMTTVSTHSTSALLLSPCRLAGAGAGRGERGGVGVAG